MAIAPITHIEIAQGVRGPKPRIAGTGITVKHVVSLHERLGESIENIAENYDLTPAQIYAALSYYYDHKDEIDRQIAEDEAAYPSIIGIFNRVMEAHNLSPDHQFSSSDGEFLLGFDSTNIHFADAGETLEAIPGVEILRDKTFDYTDGSKTARLIKVRYIPPAE